MQKDLPLSSAAVAAASSVRGGERRGYSDIPAPPPRQQHDRTNTTQKDYYGPDITITIPTRGGERREGDRVYHESRKDDDRSYERESEKVNSKHGDDAYYSDWKCLECSCWNYPEDGRCHRCGAYADDMFPPVEANDNNYNHERKNSRNEEEDTNRSSRRREEDHDEEEADDVDEFGRKPAKRVKPPPKSEWPPCFETHGADYVLDTRSGMFYHATTQFFHDPQTKLYYGNRQATYFRYDEAADPKFQAVEAATAEPQEDPVLLGRGTSNKANKTTMGISIKLKTKKLPGSKKTKPAPASAPQQQDPLQRRRTADIHKWSERQEELKQQTLTTTSEQPPTPASSLADSDIARTAKGEPMCRLCQRKFPTIEKLQYHNRVSQLHADNLKKKKQQEEEDEAKKKTNETPTTAYIDRAQQRRVLYGDDTPMSTVAAAASRMDDASPPVVVRPEETLGTTHVGNQMLQKLGWKTGQSIGRRSTNTNGDPALKRDWERIEALAQQQPRPPPQNK